MEGERLFDEIKHCLEEVQKIVDEQHNARNYEWVRMANTGFNGIRRIVEDINRYNQRNTNPRTWRDHNQNTFILLSLVVRIIYYSRLSY